MSYPLWFMCSIAITKKKLEKLWFHKLLNFFQILEVNDITHLDKWLHSHDKLNLPRTELTDTQFLLPGFIDCHIHAPQMPNVGLGLDKPLLDWLNTYTFPIESEYKNEEFAQNVYEKVIVSMYVLYFLIFFTMPVSNIEKNTK